MWIAIINNTTGDIIVSKNKTSANVSFIYIVIFGLVALPCFKTAFFLKYKNGTQLWAGSLFGLKEILEKIEITDETAVRSIIEGVGLSY